MLNRANLERLRDAAVSGAWAKTGDPYLELVLELKEAGDQRPIEPLAWALRLHRADKVREIVDEWIAREC